MLLYSTEKAAFGAEIRYTYKLNHAFLKVSPNVSVVGQAGQIQIGRRKEEKKKDQPRKRHNRLKNLKIA